jgi:hypothetical protein
MNQAASELGRLARGIPKNFSKAERERRRKQMTELNRKRALAGKVKGNSRNKRTAKRAAR